MSVFGAVWHHRVLVVAAAAAGAILMWLVGLALSGSASVEATASVVVADSSEFTVGAADQPARFVGNQVEILRSLSVANRTADLLEEAGFAPVSRADLRDDLRVVASEDTDEIVIRYSHDDPARAIATVNAVLDAYTEINQEQSEATAQDALDRIDAEIEVLTRRLAEISRQIRVHETSDGLISDISQQADAAVEDLVRLQAEFDASSDADDKADLAVELRELRERIELFFTARDSSASTPEVQALLESQRRTIERQATLVERRDQILVDTALTPGIVAFQDPAVDTTPIPGFSGMRAIVAGLVLGLVGGGAFATLRMSGRDAMKYRDRFEPGSSFGLPLLADVPVFADNAPLQSRDDPRSPPAEAVRFALANIRFALDRKGRNSLMLVGSTVGAGKTTLLANIALVAARAGQKVLVIDADFGNQAASRLLLGEIPITTGLTELAAGTTTLADAVTTATAGVGADIDVVGRGLLPITAPEFFTSRTLHVLMDRISHGYDLVLVDGPPILQVAYASNLALMAGAVVLVIEHGSRVTVTQELVDRLEFIGADMIGYIYNRAPLRKEVLESEGSMRDVVGSLGEPADV